MTRGSLGHVCQCAFGGAGMCHGAAGLSAPGRRGAHCRGHLGDLCLGLERSSLCLNGACDGAVRDHLPRFPGGLPLDGAVTGLQRKPSLPRGGTRGEHVSSAVGRVRRCWGAASHPGNHHPHQGPGRDADRGAGALVLAVLMDPGSLVSSLFMFWISPDQVTDRIQDRAQVFMRLKLVPKFPLKFS